eukprot:CAMPEP_0172516592 /NCGR_PEP_ID=MMETSP1066-20121228/277483_1 /TAXON_ID=671091 /ORGANISM="Coscinodiscus wailesii, Strain CCMP2513" /LENGTH=521 /DNA_ID=CAMNT_0013298147 /DNA_START=67 /DNA_END=1632 /DNA_ORIENTATION=-
MAQKLTILRYITPSDVMNITSLLETLLQSSSSTREQQSINNHPRCQNLWVVKPAGKSRGRDIRVFSQLSKLLRYVDAGSDVGKQASQWVVQKYIENPLVIAQRKFDIRQWVLVTDWNPLKIWFYNDCYVRFAVELYHAQTTEKGEERVDDDAIPEEEEGWVSDNYRHLVNNSVSKKSSKFHDSFEAENGARVFDHMWPIEEFQKWLMHKTGVDHWNSSILGQIRDIVRHTIICAQGSGVKPRKNSWELYGYDFMIDDQYKPWLIEINASPACDYSTEVTKSFIQRALPDILKVVLPPPYCEKRDNHRTDNDCDNGSNNDHNTGWEQIYRGREITEKRNAVSFGTDMSLKGERMCVKDLRLRRRKKCQQQRREKHNINCAKNNHPTKVSGNIPATDDELFDDSDLSDYENTNDSHCRDPKIATMTTIATPTAPVIKKINTSNEEGITPYCDKQQSNNIYGKEVKSSVFGEMIDDAKAKRICGTEFLSDCKNNKHLRHHQIIHNDNTKICLKPIAVTTLTFDV